MTQKFNENPNIREFKNEVTFQNKNFEKFQNTKTLNHNNYMMDSVLESDKETEKNSPFFTNLNNKNNLLQINNQSINDKNIFTLDNNLFECLKSTGSNLTEQENSKYSRENVKNIDIYDNVTRENNLFLKSKKINQTQNINNNNLIFKQNEQNEYKNKNIEQDQMNEDFIFLNKFKTSDNNKNNIYKNLNETESKTKYPIVSENYSISNKSNLENNHLPDNYYKFTNDEKSIDTSSVYSRSNSQKNKNNFLNFSDTRSNNLNSPSKSINKFINQSKINNSISENFKTSDFIKPPKICLDLNEASKISESDMFILATADIEKNKNFAMVRNKNNFNSSRCHLGDTKGIPDPTIINNTNTNNITVRGNKINDELFNEDIKTNIKNNGNNSPKSKISQQTQFFFPNKITLKDKNYSITTFDKKI